ncbi:MAG: DegT/DnrJ/EryC1/StrS family aminotransferase [Proteobacteria bacterium]|nr:DegT/DnrJ/EryC1/StrS family aminotransferase [Pseudomonadota bacterium]
MTASIPFIDLKAQYARLKPAIAARIQRVLEHGQFILGPEVKELEAALARIAGCREAIGVASGTDALRMVLMAEQIGRGDAVFLPGFTFTATAEVVIAVGATPVFVDVAEASYNLDPAALARAIDDTRRRGALKPRAVMAVDLYGLPADYGALDAVCRAQDLFLFADAAQSFGAHRGNRAVGSLAPVTATSFYPAKPLGAYGDGGALFTDDAARAEILRSIRAHGAGGAQYDIVRLGTNGRLDTLQAAILLAKLEVFADELAARERVAQSYDRRLAGHVTLPPREAGSTSAWAQYGIRVANRDRVAARLKAQGIPTAIHYPLPLHLQPAFRQYGSGEGQLPVSEAVARTILSLPMHPYLDEPTVARIADAVVAATHA